MDLKEARVALRERSLLEVVDLALAFVAAHKGVYGRTMLVVVAPAFVATWAVAAVLGWAWAWPVAALLAVAAEAPFDALASRLVFADDVRARDALRLAARAAPRFVTARLLSVVALVLSLALLVAPAIYVGAITLFTGEVALLEGAGVGRAFARSQRIANAQLADATLGALCLGAAPWVAALVADVAGRVVLHELLEAASPEPLVRAGGSALALAGFWLAVPLVASARFLLYIGLRTRSEGWDIQTRFAALAARADAETM